MDLVVGKKCAVRPATIEDALFLSDRLRESDMIELTAFLGDGFSPREVLVEAVTLSESQAWTLVLEDGTPVAIGGVVPMGSGEIGAVWLLASQEAEKHPVAFHRAAKHMIHQVLKSDKHTTLMNMVYEKNTKTINWLRRLGAIFGHAALRVKDTPARAFIFRRSDCV